MKSKFSSKYQAKSTQVQAILDQFEVSGTRFENGDRNTIKLFDLEGQTVNIKSFKIPNLINKVVYRFFRPSKAERSFNYANRLLENGFLTPHPVAYFEEKSGVFFGRSYYISEHLHYDLTYRDLIRDSAYVGDEKILAAFARFTYDLHEKGIHFLDHSPGNTLIKITDTGYDFYLVDLNRMEFGALSFEQRMLNFERLSRKQEQIAVMAKAYSEVSGEDEGKVYDAMFKNIRAFQEKFERKKRLKKRFKFWKK